VKIEDKAAGELRIEPVAGPITGEQDTCDTLRALISEIAKFAAHEFP
jgi:hypothetical protein